MTPSIETAIFALAVSQLLVPLLNGMLARRQVKHEQAADQVPLLVQRVEAIGADVKEIKTELRVVREHDAELRLVDQRLRGLESWQGEARPQLGQLTNNVHVLMGERGARQQLQRAANLVVAAGGERSDT
ncbi:hypothetical protein FJV41_19745 [Myxococcus llanfairpwllgwyngyllgogerychwyrndrobwllllantysiliogogogochensis]|uniref:Uncharacterized protein n=1 Tax=Myxococcus llanfairpwllgwyngyllgogerychwyrndrobwllllantysiliogogogochensis TaxID=2590453 RepID=A0A540WYX7_9BACT|nr:hypothetical protein [Myxococcus llanfairpwllgwyngyllgogerychwyrndrobwllllantysiliogogogochensis]TQF14205.1 hypothetical protein FJV41_19745 [Myxococcus llanfairpwllgwyngyllgogerychwyrndrobwllllantysiliogogogochensis]